MNESRKALADLFARLHGMGVESADIACDHCKGTGRQPWSHLACIWCDGSKVRMPHDHVILYVLSEMMNVDTPGITTGDVLDAAKKAGVY